MKKTLLMAAVALSILSACKNKSAEDNAAATDADTTVTTEVDATATTAAQDSVDINKEAALKEGDEITVNGKVTEITNGKDGYMAKIETADSKKYTVTISIPNLKDPKQFKTLKPGDAVEATGEVFMLGDETGVKATSIK